MSFVTVTDDFKGLEAHKRNIERLASLPPAVKRRIKALKKIQLEATQIEANFFKEVHNLECKYDQLYATLYSKRIRIVNGISDPSDDEDECQWPADQVGELSKALEEKVKVKETIRKKVRGISEFWLTVFKNSSLLNDMVQPHDIPILTHLVNVKTVRREEPMSFMLKFYFTSNHYFSNTILTKEYLMKCEPNENNPFGFEGPEIFKSNGCTINWHENENVTVKTIRKIQCHEKSDDLRVVVSTEKNKSFFNFFTPPTIPEDTKAVLTSDFEIGCYIKNQLVPRAVLYFTGEGVQYEYEYFEDEADEEECDSGTNAGEGRQNQE